jgi:DNA primase large subunit
MSRRLLHIICRTVCGCEQIIRVPFATYPPDWKLPYVRTRRQWVLEEDARLSNLDRMQYRRFMQTGMTGEYGFPVYLEEAE